MSQPNNSRASEEMRRQSAEMERRKKEKPKPPAPLRLFRFRTWALTRYARPLRPSEKLKIMFWSVSFACWFWLVYSFLDRFRWHSMPNTSTLGDYLDKWESWLIVSVSILAYWLTKRVWSFIALTPPMQSTAHGSSRWSTYKDLRKNGLLYSI